MSAASSLSRVAAHDLTSRATRGRDASLGRLRNAIDQAAHLLPAQGPITVFIHHNTLHAFEDLPFHEAVQKGARVFGCQPYLTEDRYREELARGRIRLRDLEAVLREDLGDRAAEPILGLVSRLDLRLAMLHYAMRTGPAEELRWFVAETDALRRIRTDVSAALRGHLIAETRRWVMRDLRGCSEAGCESGTPWSARPEPGSFAELIEQLDGACLEDWSEATWESFTLQALWRVCCAGVAGVPVCTPLQASPVRHRDLLLQAIDADTDLLVHAILVPFSAAFLDQGVAHWQLPQRDAGFYRAFLAIYGEPGELPAHWARGLARELGRLEAEQVGPLESIRESLLILGVAENEWDGYLAATLLALRGWAGITRFLEERGDRAVHPIPKDSLSDFLAVRLVLDRLALASLARDTLNYHGPLSLLRDELRARGTPFQPPGIEQRAFLVFQHAQVLGWTPEELYRMNEKAWGRLVAEIEAFSALERRRLFHLAYERRFTTEALDALALHNRRPRLEPAAPHFQAMFCIDEREESLRRHLEEVAPNAVTYGAALAGNLDQRGDRECRGGQPGSRSRARRAVGDNLHGRDPRRHAAGVARVRLRRVVGSRSGMERAALPVRPPALPP